MLATRNFGDWHTVVGEVTWSSMPKTTVDCHSKLILHSPVQVTAAAAAAADDDDDDDDIDDVVINVDNDRHCKPKFCFRSSIFVKFKRSSRHFARSPGT